MAADSEVQAGNASPAPQPTQPREQQAEVGTRLSAQEIHDNVIAPGEKELERSVLSLFWSALASGLVMGFSFLASAYVTQLVSPEYANAAAAAVYPLGFMFVIMARSELFTENTLVPVIPFLHRRDAETFRQLVKVWGVLLVGNLIGALLYALVLARTPMVSAALDPALLQVAEHATEGGFWTVAYKAVFAGWLIALLSWLLASTHSTGAQLVLIWLATAPISAFNFRHCVAGSIEAFYRADLGAASWGEMIGSFVVPAVLGNAVGGVLLVALLNYGQVAAETDESGGKPHHRYYYKDQS